ncbi:MAG: DUF3300 domain-containing protein [Beijerinckiaceae bacterium]
MEDLAYLLGPIALYPDPLLALVLTASTFPVQVVEANEWAANNRQAVMRGDFASADAMPWDGSIRALLHFPEEIALLADHLEWSQSLGMAFALQPSDVSNAIQMLRAKAESAGNLKSTPQQRVEVREDAGARTIYIAPANPERIYVPRYDSTTVFNTFVPGATVFAAGVIVGSAWNNSWGWNNRHWNQVWITPPVWHPPPPNWRPRPDRPGARPPAAWRPDRPGSRPDRPAFRPDRPGGARPDLARPERPSITRPDRPNAGRPERPGVRPERPAVRPERPAAGANRPGAQRPQGARPQSGGRPAQSTRPSRPAAQPQRVRPPQQAARPQQPAARPQARPPQQRARPQPQRARPQPQRARPQPTRRQ